MKPALPPLNWLRAFDAAARHLSFTAAAGELNMTQSAVSQQIKSLEGFLGRPLFYRLSRRLELTEAGNLYLPWVQDSFRVLTQGTEAVLGPAPSSATDTVSKSTHASRRFSRNHVRNTLCATANIHVRKLASSRNRTTPSRQPINVR